MRFGAGAAVFEFRLHVDDLTFVGRNLHAHCAVLRLCLRHAAVALHTLVNFRHAQADCRRLAEKDFLADGALCARHEHGKFVRRTIFLHIYRRHPDIKCPGREKLVKEVAINLRRHVVNVRRKDIFVLCAAIVRLLLFLHLAEIEAQDVRQALVVPRASAIADGHGTE